MPKQRADYVSLPQCDTSESLSASSPDSKLLESCQTTSIRVAIGFMFLVCILCTLVNVVLFLHEPKRGVTPLPFLTMHDMESLRRPSQYIGFENISRPFPPIPRQFENFPVLLTQVDSQHPSKVFLEDLEAYLSPVGTISPDYKQVLLTDTVCKLSQTNIVVAHLL